MSLTLQTNENKLVLQDEALALQFNLHEGLQLLNKIDKALINLINNTDLKGKDFKDDALASIKIKSLNTLEVTQSFYCSLLESLMLLGTRDRQLLIGDAPLMVLTCLMYLVKGKPAEQLLRDNLSQRNLNKIDEELSYFDLDINTILDDFLLPFFNHLNSRLAEKKLTLQDPQGIYFKMTAT